MGKAPNLKGEIGSKLLQGMLNPKPLLERHWWNWMEFHRKKLYTRWYVGSREDGNSRRAMDEVKIAKKIRIY
jgi:hypothetical protein